MLDTFLVIFTRHFGKKLLQGSSLSPILQQKSFVDWCHITAQGEKMSCILASNLCQNSKVKSWGTKMSNKMCLVITVSYKKYPKGDDVLSPTSHLKTTRHVSQMPLTHKKKKIR